MILNLISSQLIVSKIIIISVVNLKLLMWKLFSWNQVRTSSMTLIDRLVYLIHKNILVGFSYLIPGWPLQKLLWYFSYYRFSNIIYITFQSFLISNRKCEVLFFFHSLIFKIFYLNFSHEINYIFMLGLSYVSPFLICLLADNIILFYQHIFFSHH